MVVSVSLGELVFYVVSVVAGIIYGYSIKGGEK